MTFPIPHGNKLKARRENDKLPDSDKDRVEDAIEKYEAWIAESKENVNRPPCEMRSERIQRNKHSWEFPARYSSISAARRR